MTFCDTSGLSLGLLPPSPAVELVLPDLEKIYRHAGEGSFGYLTSRLNFLMEMTKLFPDYMNKMYAGAEITDDDLNQFGHATSDACESSIMNWNSNDSWTGAAGRGFDPEYFGYGHPITFEGEWFGANQGMAGSKNLDWDRAAYDDDCFDKKGVIEYDDPECDDPLQYYDITQLGSTDALGDYRAYLTQMQDYLKNQYGEQSYYEIVMSGINDTSFNIVNKSGADQAIDLGSVSWGNFAYDGESGEGAFLLMVALVRSRRMIYQAMSEFFGPNNLIFNADGSNEATDNASILQQFEYTMQQKLGGAHANNKTIFYMFFAAQHYLHAIMAAYSGGKGYESHELSGINDSASNLTDEGFVGWMRSARDMLAFKKFRDWIRTNAWDYAEGDSNKEKLYKEFTFDFAQPYGTDASNLGSDDGGWVGWDYYYHNLTTPGGDYAWDTDPYYNSSDNGHNWYAVSQLCNLSGAQIRGRALFNDGTGGALNMPSGNWVVHAAYRNAEFKDKASCDLYTTIAINFNENARFRRQTKEFEAKLKERKETEREEKYQAALAQAKGEARMRELNAQGKKKKAKTGSSHKPNNSNHDNTMTIAKVNKQKVNDRRPNETSRPKPNNNSNAQRSKPAT